mgnify:FL=1
MGLNKVTIRNRYALTLISSLVKRLDGTTIDREEGRINKDIVRLKEPRENQRKGERMGGQV